MNSFLLDKITRGLKEDLKSLREEVIEKTAPS